MRLRESYRFKFSNKITMSLKKYALDKLYEGDLFSLVIVLQENGHNTNDVKIIRNYLVSMLKQNIETSQFENISTFSRKAVDNCLDSDIKNAIERLTTYIISLD